MLRRADRYYKRYLSTDDPDYLASAIEEVGLVFNRDRSAVPNHFIQVSGWAASPHLKIGFIEVHSSLGVTRFKPNMRREDVSLFYGSKKLLRSGFDFQIPVADEKSLVQVRIITKAGSLHRLNISDSAQGVVTNQHEDGIPVGSIDSSERITLLRQERLWHTAKNAGIDLVNISEIFIAMYLLKNAAQVIKLLSDIPTGTDRRIDRIRYVVEPLQDANVESKHEVLKVKLLDKGTLDKCPTPQCIAERDVIVQSGSLLVDNQNRFIVADRAARPEFDFVSGQWEQAIGSHARLGEVQILTKPRPDEELDFAVSLLGRNPENYFHSLVEYLPRYFTARASGLLKEHVFLLNSEAPSTIKFAAESLIPRHMIRYVSKNDSFVVKELLIPTFHSQTYDSTQIPWEYSGRMDWRPVEQFARQMIDLHLGPKQDYPDFFAIRSGGLRAIPNSKRLIQIAQDEGFEILDLSKLSFVEQLNRLYWSRRMIIPGGAGLAGMIFMQPGTPVLTLATAEQKQLGTYRAMAEHANVDLNYLLGVSTVSFGEGTHRMNQIHASFVISPKEFKRAIRQM